jgi:hypothetical protein
MPPCAITSFHAPPHAPSQGQPARVLPPGGLVPALREHLGKDAEAALLHDGQHQVVKAVPVFVVCLWCCVVWCGDDKMDKMERVKK